MEKSSLAGIVILSGGSGDTLTHHVEKAAQYPGKFKVYAGVRPPRDKRDSDDLGELLAAQVEDAHDRGADGIGEVGKWGLHGLNWEDQRLEGFWSKLEELKMPINWHVGDPHRYWMPHGKYNTLEADSYYGKMRICAAVQSGNVFGCQFHPEKSGKVGLSIISCFLSL